MSDAINASPVVKAWYEEQRLDGIKHLNDGFVPLIWIHAADIQSSFLCNDLPEPSEEEAHAFLAEHLSEIRRMFTGDMDAFWIAISEAIPEQKSEGEPEPSEANE
jgi:hypothetical protein